MIRTKTGSTTQHSLCVYIFSTTTTWKMCYVRVLPFGKQLTNKRQTKSPNIWLLLDTFQMMKKHDLSLPVRCSSSYFLSSWLTAAAPSALVDDFLTTACFKPLAWHTTFLFFKSSSSSSSSSSCLCGLLLLFCCHDDKTRNKPTKPAVDPATRPRPHTPHGGGTFTYLVP